MNRLAALLALSLFSASLSAHAGSEDRYWNIGPMLHYEFGENGGGGFTFGIEASYWQETADNWPIGWDAGVEFAQTGIRLYTEAQTGILLGISAGPYLEFPYARSARGPGSEGVGPRMGFQGSAWGWWLAGADLRFHWGGEDATLAPGLFAKMPQCVSDCGEGFGP